MTLAAIHIRNLRGLRTQVDLEVSAFTALIGKNEAGKSTILEALAIFFGSQKIDQEDASKGGDQTDVAIGCEFADLPVNIILDATHSTTLQAEFLLNDKGRLEIWKIFDVTAKKIASSVSANALLPTDPDLRDLLLKKNSELKAIVKTRSIATPNVNLSINSELRDCIQKASAVQPTAHHMLPLDKEDARAIWAQLELMMPTFALFKADRPSTDQDDEAQEPLKVAVMEALRAQEQALSGVASAVESQVTTIAKATLAKLQEMAPELASELCPQFSAPDWSKVFKMSLSSDQGVAVNKRGSGVRRLILLSFFRARVEANAPETNASGVIYAVEEPETSQHPNNQRMLCQALMQLAEQESCQVLLSTHTPGLARTLPLSSLRFLSVDEKKDRHIASGDEDTYRAVCAALGVHRDHDVRLFIMIEGSNDIEFLRGMSSLLSAKGEAVPDLVTLEDQGKVIFVPMGGSNLIHWKNRLDDLQVPELHLYDRDVLVNGVSPHQGNVDSVNSRGTGSIAILTGKREMENYIHADAIAEVFGASVTVAHGPNDDVPMLVAERFREHNAPGTWVALNEGEKKRFESKAKSRLNSDCVRAMTPERLTQIDTDGDVRRWLAEIASRVN